MLFWLTRLASLGFEFWLWALVAAAFGFMLAKLILLPGSAYGEIGIARQISLWRSVIGFVFITALSLPYRRAENTVDKVLGNFNMSILIAVTVTFLSLSVLRLSLRGAALERLRTEAPKIIRRVAVTAIVSFATVFYAGAKVSSENETMARSQVLFWFAIWIGGIAFYATSCWYISRHWFGANNAHPLLGPFVAAVTICVISGLELRSDGPEAIPVRLWLLINFSAVITTLGVCALEFLEHTSRGSGYDSHRRVMITAAAIVLAMTANVAFIASGSAQQMLCDSKPLMVNCVNRSSDRPWNSAPIPVEFTLSAPSGVDLNTTPPTLTNDPSVADLFYDNSYAFGNRLHAGDTAVAAWTLKGLPDRDACDRLLARQRIPSAGLPAGYGMVLCVETTRGPLARLQISSVEYGVVNIVALVFW